MLPNTVKATRLTVLVTSRRFLFKALKKCVFCHTRHTNDASESAGGQGLGAMNRDRYRVRMTILNHHVVAALDSFQTEPKLLQRSYRLPAVNGGKTRHLADSDKAFQFG